ncbi:MAG: hypothetical protein WC457_00175 [Patescibacteria group bacterium]
MAPREEDQPNFFERKTETWQRYWHAVSAQEQAVREMYFAGLVGGSVHNGPLPPDYLNTIFSGIITCAEDDIISCLEKYMPPELSERLKPAPLSLIGPLDILALAGGGQDSWDRQSFEAIRLLELALGYANMHINLGADVGRSKLHDLGQPISFINDQERNLSVFLRSLNLGLCVDAEELVVYLSPADKWTCKEVVWKDEETTEQKERLLTCGYVRIERQVLAIVLKEMPSTVAIGAAAVYFNNEDRPEPAQNNGRTIRAIVHARQKGFFEAFAQGFRKGQRRFYFSRDMRGLRLVTFNKEDAHELHKFFLQASGFAKPKKRMVAKLNEHSSKRIHLFSQSIRLAGRSWEVQFWPDARHIFNVLLSTEEEAHSLYHLRGYLEYLFPQMFPFRIYGVNWQNPDVKNQCEEHVKALIERRNRNLR